MSYVFSPSGAVAGESTGVEGSDVKPTTDSAARLIKIKIKIAFKPNFDKRRPRLAVIGRDADCDVAGGEITADVRPDDDDCEVTGRDAVTEK